MHNNAEQQNYVFQFLKNVGGKIYIWPMGPSPSVFRGQCDPSRQYLNSIFQITTMISNKV